MSIVLRDVAKHYEPSSRSGVEVPALQGVDLEVEDGELLVVVGPSGSGKTTLLRCIAGLESVDAGRVEVNGRDVTHLRPGERDVAMVFQDYALYPHMSVRQNIAFGLAARKVEAGATGRRVATAASHLGIAEVLERAPSELSGGERQRVALARAMVREPAAFLMDEPLSNLDAELRVRMRTEIRELVEHLGRTTLFVTHDQVEAMTIGDRVAVLRAGRVEQVGTPSEIYDRPASAFVARFIGSPPMNLFGPEICAAPAGAPVAGLRPEKIDIVSAGGGRFDATVRAVETIGWEAIVHLTAGGGELSARVDREAAPQRDEVVGVEFRDEDLHGFAGPDGRALS